ncbi:MAG: VCBS repeat-containing protein [Myxococcales bacterium]|nr:VCBS repeat-containing protein [Myxococcales bacterium]
MQSGVVGFSVTPPASDLVALGDVNGDGFADVGFAGFVVFGEPDPGPLQDDPAALALRGFSVPSPDDPEIRFDPLPAGDVNGDGLDDIMVVETPTKRAWVIHGKDDLEPANLDLVALGVGGFVVDAVEAALSWNRVDHPGVDVDGDGLDDLAFIAKTGTMIIRGQIDGEPLDLSTTTPLALVGGSHRLTGGDFDDDGIVDLVWCNSYYEAEVLRAPSGWSANAREMTNLTPAGCDRVLAGDLDGGGVDDLLFFEELDLELGLRIHRGPLPLDDDVLELNDDCLILVNHFAFADVDGDGRLDLVDMSIEGVLRATAPEAYSPNQDTLADCSSSCQLSQSVIASFDDLFFLDVVALGDINGDGRHDVYTQDAGAIITEVCDQQP